MAFQLPASPPLTVTEAVELNGHTDEVTFTLRPFTRTEILELKALNFDDPDALEAFWSPERLAAKIEHLDATDQEGAPIPSTPAVWDALYVDCPELYGAAVRAVVTGVAERARKNSPPSRGGTTAPDPSSAPAAAPTAARGR